MAQSLYVLFEHAVGYGLFQVKEFDEMALLAPRVEQSVLDLSKFSSVVKTVSFSAFKTAKNALENMQHISEGMVHEDLKVFLDSNLPKSSKKLKVLLGVGETKLAASLVEQLKLDCVTTGVIPELIRGIRVHFANLIKDSRLNEVTLSKAQLGLGHNYSRSKVKFNVNRVDNMIIQSSALLEQVDKDVNTFSMRIREWYSYHFPELIRIVPDNYTFAKTVQLIKDRKQMSVTAEDLEEVVMDSAKALAILEAARTSMGMDISPVDLINIQRLCNRVVDLADFRKELAQYLVSRMQSVAPNLAALIGEQVAARLISHAGSLTNLAKYPASTVQILGAEKALFRALKTRGNTPKYGIIFHSTFIGRAAAKNKGRISRYLANKCSIASRIDCFTEKPSSVFGDHLRQQVEDRLKFFDTGDAPAKNIDIMRQALTAAKELQAKEAKEKKEKKKKKKSKRQAEEDQSVDSSLADTTVEVDEVTPKKKKSKKRSRDESEAESQADASVNDTMDAEESEEPKKKKKKKKRESEVEINGDTTNGEETPVKKEKKKKRKSKGTAD